jgi:hypothetical protein
MKKCSECKQWKAKAEFHKRTLSRDGLQPKCKKCSLKNYKIRYINQAEERRKKSIEYRKTHKTKHSAETCIKTRSKFPEKRKASIYVTNHLPKVFEGYERHHWCYREDSFLDVFLFTVKEHRLIHRFMLYDSEMLLYRVKETGSLIYTREGASRFYNLILNREKLA